MSAIDQRIVEMKFENHLFERNAATSIKTLDKLKQALDFNGTSNSINELEKSANKIDFSSLANSVSNLESRFSTFGIAGMTVIQNLTNEAMKLGHTLVNKVMGPITTGGWNRATNIDKAKFQLEGLHVAWSEIEKDINYGVSDTAYGLDAAAQAASQLVASGVKFGETYGETGNSPMAKALRGISGVAAMTNSSYEEISSIFTTVAGQGKLMTMQLRQLESRGLNAAANLGKVMDKTEEEIRSMVSKGEIDFATFSEKMDEAFGEHAKAANKTFEGALANMKSALGRIGAEFAGPFRANMIQVYNQLREMFNLIKKEKLTQVFADFADFAEKASNLVTNVLKNIDLSWMDRLVDSVHSLYVEFDGLMSKFFPFWKKTEENSEEVLETTTGLLKTAEEVNEVAAKVLAGEYGSGEDRIAKLKEEGYIYEQIQNAVNEMMGNDFRYDLTDIKELLELQEVKEATDDIKKNVAETNEELDSNSNMAKIQRITRNAHRSVDGLSAAFNILKNVAIAVGKGAFGPLVRIGLTISDTFFNIVNSLRDTLVHFNQLLTHSKAYEAITAVVYAVLTKIAEAFEWVSGGIDKLLHSKTPLTTFFEGLQKGFGTEKIQSFSEWLETATGKLLDFAKVLVTGGLDTVFDLLGKILGRAIKLVPTIAKILPVAWGISKIINLFRTPKGLITSVRKTFAEVPKALKGFTNNLNAEALLKVAAAIGVLAVSLGLISLIPTDKLLNVVLAIGILAGILGGLWLALDAINNGGEGNIIAKTISQISNAFTNDMNATAIIKVAAAIAILAASMFLLGHLSWDQLLVGAAAIGILTIAIIALYKGITKNYAAMNPVQSLVNTFKTSIMNLGKSIQNFFSRVGTAALIASLTAFVLVVGLTISKLAGIDWASGIKACTFIGIMMFELVGTLALIKRFADGVGSIGMAVFVAAIAFFVSSLGKTMVSLSSISWADGFKGIIFIGIILAELIITLGLIKRFADGVGGIKLSFFMKALASVLDSMSDTVVKLSAIPFGAGLKAVFFLGVLLAELLASLKYLSTLTKTEGALGTIKIVVLMATLALVADSLSGTIERLSKINFSSGIKSILFLGLLFGELVGFTALSSKIKGEAGIKSILLMLGFALAVKMLTDSMIKLAEVDPERLKVVTLVIGSLAIVFAGFTAIVQYSAQSGKWYKGLLSILPAIIVLASVVIAIRSLSSVDPKTIEAAGKAIAAIMATMALFTAATKIPGKTNMASLLVTFGGLAVLIAEIAGIFYLMRNMNPEQMLGISRAMSTLMLSLGVMSFAVGHLGGLKQGAGSVLAADILLANIVAIEALAAFVNDKFPGFKTFLDKGLPLLEAIGRGIGTFFGSILGSVIEQVIGGVGNGLGTLGTGLNTFVENIKPFLESVKGLEGYDTSTITNLGSIMSAVGIVGWKSFEASIAGAFADPTGLSSPLKNIKTFVDNFVEFNNSLAEITEDQSSKLDIIDSVIKKVGNISWDTFVSKVQAHFAGDISFKDTFKSLRSFTNQFIKFDSKLAEVTDAETALSKLDTIKSVIEKLGSASLATFVSGIKKNLLGENSITSIGQDLLDFAQLMVDYSGKVVGIEDGAVKKSKKCAAIISALVTEVPTTGGILDFFTGNTDLETFGTGLVTFGEKVVTYTNTIKDVSFKKAKAAINAIKEMNDIFTEINNSGGLSAPSYVIGDNLNTLGQAISQIFGALAVSVTNVEAQENLAESGRKMFGYLMNGFTDAGSQASLDENQNTVIQSIIDSLLKGLTDEEAKSLTGDKAREVMTSMVSAMSDAIITDGVNLSDSFGDAVETMLQAGTDKIDEDPTGFVTAMETLLKKIIDKIKEYESKFTDRIGTLCELMVGKLQAYESKFETVGINMMSGLTQGIKSGKSKAITAAAEAAAESYQAAKDAIESDSPAKKFIELGEYAMEGYALGIIQNDRPISEITKVAESSLGAMTGALEGMGNLSQEALSEFYSTITATWLYITSLVDQDLIYKPVISPVMDLSSVKDGVDSANYMLKGFHGMTTPILDYSNKPLEVKTGDLYNQKALIDAITGVQKNVEQLGTEMSKMQVLMNTGEVVGAITSGVDRELGSIQKYNVRWA